MPKELVVLLLSLFFSLGTVLDGRSEGELVVVQPPDVEIGVGIEPGG